MPSKPLTPTRAWSCILINQLATPGLGSIMAGRYISGTLQLVLALLGFVLLMIWLCKCFYGLAFQPLDGPAPENNSYGWMGKWGVIFFGASWLWSGVTSLLLWRQLKANETVPPGAPPPTPGQKL